MRIDNLKCWEYLSSGSGVTNKGGIGQEIASCIDCKPW